MYNSCLLVGRVSKHPVHTTTKSGIKAVKLYVETTESKDTQWHCVNLYGDFTKFATDIAENDLVLVSGRIITRKYDKGGQKSYYTSISASKIKKLKEEEKSQIIWDVADEEIPF
jgi:single-stranded DNA-binding protein